MIESTELTMNINFAWLQRKKVHKATNKLLRFSVGTEVNLQYTTP